jgi:hypothetical protein
MNKISLILTTLLTLSLVVIIAPNIFAANQGKTLRNIAIWLAIFVGLGLFYQNFGPGSAHPMFSAPAVFSKNRMIMSTPEENKANNSSDDGAQGFTPPKE